MQEKTPSIYILANKKHGTLYTGVTSNLWKRIHEHKNDAIDGFTKRYGVHILVYYEVADTMFSAIEREKQIKGGSRQKKIQLIQKDNPDWNDLIEKI